MKPSKKKLTKSQRNRNRRLESRDPNPVTDNPENSTHTDTPNPTGSSIPGNTPNPLPVTQTDTNSVATVCSTLESEIRTKRQLFQKLKSLEEIVAGLTKELENLETGGPAIKEKNPDPGVPKPVSFGKKHSQEKIVAPAAPEMDQNLGNPTTAQPVESATSSNTGNGTTTTADTSGTLGLESIEEQGENTADKIELGTLISCIPENRMSPYMAWMKKYNENPSRLDKFHVPKFCVNSPKIPTVSTVPENISTKGEIDERQEMAGEVDRREKLGRMDPPKIFECSTCGKRYDNKLNFDTHIRYHAQGIRCKYCNQAYECPTELLPHELLNTYTEDRRHDNFGCTFCLEIFES